MKKPDRTKEVTAALSRQRTLPLDIPATLKGVKQTSVPVKVGDQVIDRKVTYLKLKLPNGAYLECRVEGTTSVGGLVDVLTEDPHFESLTQDSNG